MIIYPHKRRRPKQHLRRIRTHHGRRTLLINKGIKGHRVLRYHRKPQTKREQQQEAENNPNNDQQKIKKRTTPLGGPAEYYKGPLTENFDKTNEQTYRKVKAEEEKLKTKRDLNPEEQKRLEELKNIIPKIRKWKKNSTAFDNLQNTIKWKEIGPQANKLTSIGTESVRDDWTKRNKNTDQEYEEIDKLTKEANQVRSALLEAKAGKNPGQANMNEESDILYNALDRINERIKEARDKFKKEEDDYNRKREIKQDIHLKGQLKLNKEQEGIYDQVSNEINEFGNLILQKNQLTPKHGDIKIGNFDKIDTLKQQIEQKHTKIIEQINNINLPKKAKADLLDRVNINENTNPMSAAPSNYWQKKLNELE
jgi:hypothetical protein